MFQRLRKQASSQSEMTLVEHLAELRRRIIITLLTLAAGVVIGFYFSDEVVAYVTRLPGSLVYLHPGESFFVHLKLALVLGLAGASPMILYQLVGFVSPALDNMEKRVLFVGIPFSVLLFVGGVAFAYQVIVPIAYRFFMSFGSGMLQPLISIGNYVSFVLGIILPFGAVFQLPLVVVLLCRVGILTPQILTRYRKFIVLGVFLIAAVLTPPDIISQTLMALPMLILYELSIVLGKVVVRKGGTRH